MSDKNERHDKLVNALTHIKNTIVANEKGELYISWKGSSLFIKETHIIELDPMNLLTRTEK